MLYVKVIKGWCEITYNFEGKPLSTKFVQNESEQIERRAQRDASDGEQKEGQLEDDELVEHPDDIEYLESKEKYCHLEMVQPDQSSS